MSCSEAVDPVRLSVQSWSRGDLDAARRACEDVLSRRTSYPVHATIVCGLVLRGLIRERPSVFPRISDTSESRIDSLMNAVKAACAMPAAASAAVGLLESLRPTYAAAAWVQAAMYFPWETASSTRAVFADMFKCARLYAEAAERGFAAGLNSLGCRYEDGEGVALDKAEAVRLFRAAGDLGHTTASYNYARMVRRCEGVNATAAEAAAAMERAVLMGSTDAMKCLGVMALRGEGIAKDETRAARLFEMAVERGETQAKDFLALMAATGPGTWGASQDMRRAGSLWRETANKKLKTLLAR
eukprot:m51a1_g2504 hypothetical protein (300) ;mRNA; f:134450-135408